MSINLYEGRSISVPPGHIVVTGYVPIQDVELACKERMAIGDVDRAYQRRIQIAPNQPFPPPRGRWRSTDKFIIEDGRHDYVAALMLGVTHILVAWERPQ